MEYPSFKEKVLSSRVTGAARSSLANPAEKIFKTFQHHEKIALLGVQCLTPEDVMTIYGYLVEPAFRWGCTLLICGDLSRIKCLKTSFVPDHHWRYPWTLERLQYLLKLGRQPSQVTVSIPVTRWRQLGDKLSFRRNKTGTEQRATQLDPQQNAAVSAGNGVIQVIAPAGSGKTTVLIERVKELRRRGTPAGQILCMSFNRDAKVEIGQRLIKAGVEGVVVRSFHGMGLAILKAENRLRKSIGEMDEAKVEQIITQAMVELAAEPGKEPSVTDTRNIISSYKLSAMISPHEAQKRATEAGHSEQIAARIFTLYEQELVRSHSMDFDDLVAKTVTLLQTDQEVRQRWQNQFKRVLVDEYQDIEPSQALLVGILAAPQDSLFCVGDEDQCIYAWRRATVQRIIELDQMYPGLERHALIRNYRCGKRITNASRNLIRHNRVRFNKPLLAGSREKGEIVVASFSTRTAGAIVAARMIHGADPKKVVVLARTSRLLEEVSTAGRRLFETNSQVELATIHAAKGREWDRVILFGVDEGQTPHGHCKDEEGLEDERRLFYVAMTRAQLRLEIICTRGLESRFLKEAGLR